MAEYIERKLLIDKFDRMGLGEHSFAERVFSDGVRTIIAGIPAADVAPVVHGRWDILDGYKTRRVCSVCGWDVPEYGKFYSYCPNCGARMDGDAE